MKRFIGILSVTLFGCAIGWGPLRAQPKITIAPSPNPLVAIVPIEQSGSAPAAAVFAGTFSNLEPSSFFVENRTSQPILAFVILCVGTEPRTGKTRTARMMSEGFQNAAFNPVLKPGSRVLVVTPTELVPESKITWWASIPPNPSILRSNSDWLGAVSSVNISLDSIVFASGEVDGPDTEHFMQEVTSRKQAADSVLAAINANNSEAISAMVKQPAQPNDNHFSEWQSRFARHYSTAADPAGKALEVQILQGYPVPPPLFRAAASTSN